MGIFCGGFTTVREQGKPCLPYVAGFCTVASARSLKPIKIADNAVPSCPVTRPINAERMEHGWNLEKI